MSEAELRPAALWVVQGNVRGVGVSGAEKCFLGAMTAAAHEGQAGMPGAYCIKKPRKQTTCEVRYDL